MFLQRTYNRRSTLWQRCHHSRSLTLRGHCRYPYAQWSGPMLCRAGLAPSLWLRNTSPVHVRSRCFWLVWIYTNMQLFKTKIHSTFFFIFLKNHMNRAIQLPVTWIFDMQYTHCIKRINIIWSESIDDIISF